MSGISAASAGGPVARTLRRGRRRLGGLLRRSTVDFVYSMRYQLELPGLLYDPRRGEQILAFLDSAGLLGRQALHAPVPATFRQLRRVHTDDYLDSLNLPGALNRIAGLTLPEALSDRVLAAQRFMVGGTLKAAALALQSGGIAVNLGGGFHHAFAGKGERFCIYNDVAAAIAELRAGAFADRVLVVDLDVHDGDGTRAIFARDSSVHTFSIHNRTSVPADTAEDAVEATAIELGFGVGDAAYLDAVRSSLPPVFAAFQPAMVFYLAGTDPAAGDQIGDWKISAAGLLERDRFVLDYARGARGDRRLPLVIALAGGYGLNAWRYSARFFSALLNRGRALEPPSTEEALLVRYRRLAQELEPHELTGEPRRSNDWGLTEDDITGSLGGPHSPRRFLGYYSPQGLELALERAGLLDRVRALGFEHPAMEMDLDNPTGDTVRLYGDTHRRELLIEARARIDRGAIPGLALLRIEWLLLQNPRAEFTADRPRLPGQSHPGLGMSQDIVALLILACDRLQLDGLVFVPAHYHSASQSRKWLRFLDPADEGVFRALQQALHGLPLSEAARAVDEKRVVDAETGEPFVWRPMPMGLPVTDRFRALVDGEEYKRMVAEEAQRHAYRVLEA
ncbi:MAG TPA: histone deacetylase [Thermoanaerobaculia bacterium]|nr:histone deacetylase [Thermoanaerobaculia bacterium]